MALNFSVFEAAKQRAQESAGGGDLNFFNLKDGESKTIRFLDGLKDTVVVSHSCGLEMLDIDARDWQAAKDSGTPYLCPMCGQPLSDDDVLYERPSVIAADMHNYVMCGDGNRGKFVCLGSKLNADMGIIPTDDNGMPLHECPVCSHPSNRNKQGNPKRPVTRILALAVEMEVMYEQRNVNGRIQQVPAGIRDVVTDEGAPKIVMVDFGYNNFWSVVEAAVGGINGEAITDYIWRVTRIGEGTSTKYDVQRVNSEPQPVDRRLYEDGMPDLKRYLSSMASVDRFAEKGFPVGGAPKPAQQNFVREVSRTNYGGVTSTSQTVYPAQPPANGIAWDNLTGQNKGFMGR